MQKANKPSIYRITNTRTLSLKKLFPNGFHFFRAFPVVVAISRVYDPLHDHSHVHVILNPRLVTCSNKTARQRQPIYPFHVARLCVRFTHFCPSFLLPPVTFHFVSSRRTMVRINKTTKLHITSSVEEQITFTWL